MPSGTSTLTSRSGLTAQAQTSAQTEVYTAQYRTTLTQSLGTARAAVVHVAATQSALGVGSFSIAIYDVGTDANPVNFEALQVISGGATLSWTAITEAGWNPVAHASGSTVLVTVLTPRSITSPLNNHVNQQFAPNPHLQYIRQATFQHTGDLLVGTGVDTFTPVPATANGSALIVDPTQPAGVRWAPISSQSIPFAASTSKSVCSATSSLTAIALPQTYGPSGPNHHSGDVPDPGIAPGTSHFLREDVSWISPNGLLPVNYPNNQQLVATTSLTATAVDQVFGASGFTHSTGDVSDPGASAGSTHYLREDTTWVVPTISPIATGGLRTTLSSNQTVAAFTNFTVPWDTNEVDTFGQHPLTPTPGTLTGTVTETFLSHTLVGSGTSFLTQVAVGQVIQLNTTLDVYVVTAVTDNTHLTITPSGNNTQAGQTATTLKSGIVFPTAGVFTVEVSASWSAVAGVLTLNLILNSSDGTFLNGTQIAQYNFKGVSVSGQTHAFVTTRHFNQWDYILAPVAQGDGTSQTLQGTALTHLAVY